jgi:hypothetical protein
MCYSLGREHIIQRIIRASTGFIAGYYLTIVTGTYIFQGGGFGLGLGAIVKRLCDGAKC